LLSLVLINHTVRSGEQSNIKVLPLFIFEYIYFVGWPTELCLFTLKGGQQNWGTETAVHALKKEANWIEFITIFAERDPTQENMMAELRFRKNIDLLLQAQSHFMKATDHDVSSDTHYI